MLLGIKTLQRKLHAFCDVFHKGVSLRFLLIVVLVHTHKAVKHKLRCRYRKEVSVRVDFNRGCFIVRARHAACNKTLPNQLI